MNNEIKILLADDHRLFLDGVKAIIDGHPGLKVVAEANDGEEIFVKLKAYYVDIVVVDIQNAKDEWHTGYSIDEREKYPEIKVLALSMHHEKIFIERMYNAGVSGYIFKDAGKEEMITAIKTIYGGGKYFTPDIMSAIFANVEQNLPKGMIDPELTKREIEILILIAREYSNPEIAEELHLSIQTVNTHRKNLLRKLDVKNTAGLVKYAISTKLLQ